MFKLMSCIPSTLKDTVGSTAMFKGISSCLTLMEHIVPWQSTEILPLTHQVLPKAPERACPWNTIVSFQRQG